MPLFTSILFWLGIIGLVDGSLGLLFLEKWQKLTGAWNIQKIALIEIGVAWILLLLYYLLNL